jgi:hypothetical protein
MAWMNKNGNDMYEQALTVDSRKKPFLFINRPVSSIRLALALRIREVHRLPDALSIRFPSVFSHFARSPGWQPGGRNRKPNNCYYMSPELSVASQTFLSQIQVQLIHTKCRPGCWFDTLQGALPAKTTLNTKSICGPSQNAPCIA